MKAETWREITLTDQLLECGPSNANSEFRIFSYLDFRNAGRLHNVAIMADLEGKLKKLLGVDSCTMHLILGKNAINGDAYNLLNCTRYLRQIYLRSRSTTNRHNFRN